MKLDNFVPPAAERVASTISTRLDPIAALVALRNRAAQDAAEACDRAESHREQLETARGDERNAQRRLREAEAAIAALEAANR